MSSLYFIYDVVLLLLCRLRYSLGESFVSFLKQREKYLGSLKPQLYAMSDILRYFCWISKISALRIRALKRKSPGVTPIRDLVFLVKVDRLTDI
jgi:hypothetical protein